MLGATKKLKTALGANAFLTSSECQGSGVPYSGDFSMDERTRLRGLGIVLTVSVGA